MKKQAFIYARVSTTDKQDYTRQVDELKSIAINHGYLDKNIRIFAEAISGYKKDERLELNSMLEICNSNPSSIGCVYTSEISRIGRNPTQTRKVIDNLTDLGIPVYIQSIGQFTLDKDGKRNMIMNIILQVLLEYANLEAETFKTRSKSGLLKSAKSGKAGGGATLPFGYTKDKDGMLIIKDDEADIVKFIYDTYAHGSGTKVISGMLNVRKIKTKYQNIMDKDRVIKGNLTSIKDIKWSDAQVYSIIKNPLYKGERRFKNEILKAPAIISTELWNKCDSLRKTKAHKNYITSYTYLMKDLCTCGKCNNNYFAKYKPVVGGDKVYICSSRLKKGMGCGNLGININLLDSVIFHFLIHNKDRQRLTNMENIKNLRKETWDKIKAQTDKVIVDNKLLKAKQNEKNRLLDLYLSSNISKGIFNERNTKILNEIDNISSRLVSLQRNIEEMNEAFKNIGKNITASKIFLAAQNNRNELQALFKQVIDGVVIDVPDASTAMLTVKLKLIDEPSSIIINTSGIRKRKPIYQYKVDKDWIDIDEKFRISL